MRGLTMGFDVAEVQKALAGARYPASSEDLAERALSNHAGSDLVDALRNLDRDGLEGPHEVTRDLRENSAQSKDVATPTRLLRLTPNTRGAG